MIDTKEHAPDGFPCRELTAKYLNMKETVHDQVAGLAPNTWFRGSDPIDGIWASSDLEVIGVSYLTHRTDLGNHHPVVANITMQSLLGNNISKIIPP